MALECVLIWTFLGCLIALITALQYVKVGYAGSNFPEHGQLAAQSLLHHAYMVFLQYFPLSSVGRFCVLRNAKGMQSLKIS